MSDNMQCKCCGMIVNTTYCSNCGAPSIAKRFDSKYFFEELKHALLHFEKGFFYTITELIKNPGRMIREYILGYRFKAYKPLRFFILCSVIFLSIQHFFIPEVYVRKTDENHPLGEWLLAHFGHALLLSILPVAYFLSKIFKAKGYNFLETVILISYLAGIVLLFHTTGGLITTILNLENSTTGQIISSLIKRVLPIFYGVWALNIFYKGKFFSTLLNGWVAILLGTGVTGVIVVLVEELYKYLAK